MPSMVFSTDRLTTEVGESPGVGCVDRLCVSVHLIHATFKSNCAEGLHFSAFHYGWNECTWVAK